MYYLIKSLKWSKHYKQETWYMSNSNGYTHQIAEAGIYTEEDKNSPHNASIIAEKVIEFVPIDKKVIQKAKKQIADNKATTKTEIIRLQNRIKYEEED